MSQPIHDEKPQTPAVSAPGGGSEWRFLKERLLSWRRAEKEHAVAVLTAAFPEEISRLHDRVLNIERDLRIFVDREPWASIEQELMTPNTPLTGAAAASGPAARSEARP